LDTIRFPPVGSEEAFGFVDPRDVLRACHIIPAFAGGKSHADEVSISRCARDGNDWARYYINRCVKQTVFSYVFNYTLRFVDRDMLMRYHWGLGIGHVYSHGQRADAPAPPATQAVDDAFDNTADTSYAAHEVILEGQDNDSNAENGELGFDNWEDDWVDEEYSEDELSQVDDEGDELILAMDSMYGAIDYDNHFY
jgi:hypothetical protein